MQPNTNEDSVQSALVAAVKKLKRDDVIRINEDIARKIGMSKGTFSAYLSGSQRPSKNFISKFKEHFGIDISIPPANDPEISVIVSEPTASYSQSDSYRDKYINLLEQQLGVLNQAVQGNLSVISSNQDYLSAYLKASVKRDAERFVKEDPAKLETELGKIDKIFVQILEGKKTGMGAHSPDMG